MKRIDRSAMTLIRILTECNFVNNVKISVDEGTLFCLLLKQILWFARLGKSEQGLAPAHRKSLLPQFSSDMDSRHGV